MDRPTTTVLATTHTAEGDPMLWFAIGLLLVAWLALEAVRKPVKP